MQLLSNQTVDGSSDWVPAIPDAYNGLINIYVAGDLGGGTVTIETLAPDGVTAIPLDGGEFTAATMRVQSAASAVLRATLSGATGADVSVWIEPESVDLRRIVRERI